MTQDTQKSTQLTLARAGLTLSSLMFALGAAVAFSSSASGFAVFVLAVCAALLLWVAIFAGEKVTLFLGRFFPLG